MFLLLLDSFCLAWKRGEDRAQNRLLCTKLLITTLMVVRLFCFFFLCKFSFTLFHVKTSVTTFHRLTIVLASCMIMLQHSYSRACLDWCELNQISSDQSGNFLAGCFICAHISKADVFSSVTSCGRHHPLFVWSSCRSPLAIKSLLFYDRFARFPLLI